jgi:hypothetical protein
MQVISIPDFIDVIHHVAVRNNQPIMGWGKPGVGKSQGCAQRSFGCSPAWG